MCNRVDKRGDSGACFRKSSFRKPSFRKNVFKNIKLSKKLRLRI